MDGLRLCDPKAFRETLEPERMYVETIFSEVVDGVTYLSWYSVQGEGAADVQASAHWLDEQHVVFWQECIDPDFTPQDLAPEVHVTPERVEAAVRPLDCKTTAQRPIRSHGSACATIGPDRYLRDAGVDAS